MAWNNPRLAASGEKRLQARMSKGNDHTLECKPCVYGEVGLTLLEASGDVTDGVIAFYCNWLGGETFASLDKQVQGR